MGTCYCVAVLLDYSDCWFNISHSNYRKLALIISLWETDICSMFVVAFLLSWILML